MLPSLIKIEGKTTETIEAVIFIINKILIAILINFMEETKINLEKVVSLKVDKPDRNMIKIMKNIEITNLFNLIIIYKYIQKIIIFNF